MMSDSPPFVSRSLYEDFHREVKTLSQCGTPFPVVSLFCKSCSNEELNQRKHQHFKTAVFCAKEILEKIPESNRNRQFLQEKLKTGKFKILSDGKELISHQKLKQLVQDVDHLFFNIYPKMEKNPFSKHFKMPKVIQEYLSKDLNRLNRVKKILPCWNNEEERTKRKIAKGKLAVALGRGIEDNKGATGTLIIKDVNEKPVGVLKVSEKDVPLTTRILNILKSFIGGQLTYLSRKNLAQPLSERAAYLVSKGLGFHLVPPSAVTNIKNKIGVFQVFITGESRKITADSQTQIFWDEYFEAKRVIESVDAKHQFSELENTKFQQFAIFDYVIGNLDRHEENWFVTLSEDYEITEIKAIDNANAFPRRQPAKGSIATQNQYKWQTRNLANQPFTQAVINFVQENLNPKKMKEVIALIKEDLPGFLDQDMEDLLLLRASMSYLVVQEPGQSPASLAACSSLEEIKKFLSKLRNKNDNS